MQNSKQNSTLEKLLERERKDIFKYLSENMDAILFGTEKVLKISTNEEKYKESIIPEKTRMFPTSIMITQNKFPGASFMRVDSRSSIPRLNSDDSD